MDSEKKVKKIVKKWKFLTNKLWFHNRSETKTS
jgi:hypothetical protein